MATFPPTHLPSGFDSLICVYLIDNGKFFCKNKGQYVYNKEFAWQDGLHMVFSRQANKIK